MPRYNFAPPRPDYPAAVSVAHFVSGALKLAEVAVPRALFAAILHQIGRLRGPPVAVA
jgi:hypothetical protein